MKRFTPLICTLFALVILFSCNAQKGLTLTAEEFSQKISGGEDVQLLDVRTTGEFTTGHLKNALLADWKDENEFNRRISFLNKSKPVYIYCLGGSRSAAAARKMREIGYSEVYELKGGINAWKGAGKTVEGKQAQAEMSIDVFNTAIQSNKTVLVDFGAEWCPPCKIMEPVLNSLQVNNPGKFTLLKVDGGRDEAIMKQFGVTELPVLLLFKDGKQVWRKEGVTTEKEISAQLN